MAVRASVALTSVTTSSAIPVNYASGLPTGLQINAGVGTYSVEGTTDNIFDSTVTPQWTALSGFSALTASALGSSSVPVTAVRLNVTAYTSGTFTLKVLQGSFD